MACTNNPTATFLENYKNILRDENASMQEMFSNDPARRVSLT
jgi:phage-related minor tail protein